jgi:hypothetical protein
VRSRTAIAKLGLLMLAACGLNISDYRLEEWSRAVDGTGERWGRDVATSTNGDVVLVGAFNGDAVFDAGMPTEVTLSSTGGWNSYVAAYGRNGAFEWAFSIEGNDAFVQAVAVEGRRKIAVAGYTSGTALFRFRNGLVQPVSPPPGAIEAGFVALYDFDGNLDWVHPILGDGIVQALDVDFDSGGDVVVGGVFQGTATIGALPVHSATSDGFVLVLSSNGSVLSEFETSASASGFATIWSIACFDRGDVLITGDFQGAVTLGTRTLVSEGGSEDILCARFSLGDGIVWARRVGGPGYDAIFGADVSQTDEIVLAGLFEQTAAMGELLGVPVTLTAGGVQDAFVATFDPEGTLLWANAVGGTGSTSAYAVGLDRDGAVVVTGAFNGSIDLGPGYAGPAVFEAVPGTGFDAFLAHFSDRGVLTTAYRFAGTGDEFGMGAVFGERGSVMASGAITSDTTVRGSTQHGSVRVTGDRAAYVLLAIPVQLVAAGP